WHGLLIFLIATVAMLIFAAATQHYMLVRNRWYETLLLLLVAFSLFRPGFWMDLIHDPYQEIAPAQLEQALETMEPNAPLRLRVLGENEVGDAREFSVLLPVPEGADGAERLERMGLALYEEDGRVLIDSVAYDGPAAAAGLAFDQEIRAVRAPVDRWAKEWIWIPTLLVFAGI